MNPALVGGGALVVGILIGMLICYLVWGFGCESDKECPKCDFTAEDCPTCPTASCPDPVTCKDEITSDVMEYLNSDGSGVKEFMTSNISTASNAIIACNLEGTDFGSLMPNGVQINFTQTQDDVKACVENKVPTETLSGALVDFRTKCDEFNTNGTLVDNYADVCDQITSIGSDVTDYPFELMSGMVRSTSATS